MFLSALTSLFGLGINARSQTSQAQQQNQSQTSAQGQLGQAQISLNGIYSTIYNNSILQSSPYVPNNTIYTPPNYHTWFQQYFFYDYREDQPVFTTLVFSSKEAWEDHVLTIAEGISKKRHDKQFRDKFEKLLDDKGSNE